MTDFLAQTREWLRLYSVRLAAAFAALVGLLTSQPEVLFSLIAFIPTDPTVRAIFAALVALATFLAPTLARMWPQKNLEEKSDAPSD